MSVCVCVNQYPTRGIGEELGVQREPANLARFAHVGCTHAESMHEYGYTVHYFISHYTLYELYSITESGTTLNDFTII